DRSEYGSLYDLALPRRNGELIFSEPWEGRVFSLALALHSRRPYSWAAFGAKLASELRDAGENYYEAWLSSFEALVIAEGLIGEEELRKRASEYKMGIRDSW